MTLRKRRLLFAMSIVTVLTLPSATRADFSLRQPPAVPTIVKGGFYLSEINSVNEQQENFEFEGRLIATWRDPRLAFDRLFPRGRGHMFGVLECQAPSGETLFLRAFSSALRGSRTLTVSVL